MGHLAGGAQALKLTLERVELHAQGELVEAGHGRSVRVRLGPLGLHGHHRREHRQALSGRHGLVAAGPALGLALDALPILETGDEGGLPVGVAIGPAVHGGPFDADLGPLVLRLEGGFLDDRGAQLELRPSGILVAPDLSEGVFAELYVGDEPGRPIVLIGPPNGYRVEARKFAFGLRSEGLVAGSEMRIDVAFDGVNLVFDATESDDFTRKVTGDETQRIGFDTGLSWSSRHGLTLRGQVSLRARTAVNLRLGPVSVDGLALEMSNDTGALTLSAGASGQALHFPADAVGQAPALVARLVQLFPYDDARSVAGLLARWVFGEEAELVVIDLGLMIECSGTGLHKVLVVGRGRARVKNLSPDVLFLGVDLAGAQPFVPAEEAFSLGLYQDVDLEEAISAPHTDQLQSGFALGDGAIAAGAEVVGDAGYETIKVDAPLDGSAASDPEMFVVKKAAAPADESTFYSKVVKPVSVSPPRFVTSDDGLRADMMLGEENVYGGMTYAVARAAIFDPAYPDSYRVVRRYETYVS